MQAHLALLFVTFGLAWMVYAIRGIVRKEITTHPRGVRGTTYFGSDAVRQGFFELLWGFTFAAVGLVLYLAATYA